MVTRRQPKTQVHSSYNIATIWSHDKNAQGYRHRVARYVLLLLHSKLRAA